jgi:hypothetical protein
MIRDKILARLGMEMIEESDDGYEHTHVVHLFGNGLHSATHRIADKVSKMAGVHHVETYPQRNGKYVAHLIVKHKSDTSPKEVKKAIKFHAHEAKTQIHSSKAKPKLNEEVEMVEEAKSFNWNFHATRVAQDKDTGKWHVRTSDPSGGVTMRHKTGHDSKEAALAHGKELRKNGSHDHEVEYRSDLSKGDWKTYKNPNK